MKGYKHVGVMNAQINAIKDRAQSGTCENWGQNNGRRERERLIQRFFQEKQTNAGQENPL